MMMTNEFRQNPRFRPLLRQSDIGSCMTMLRSSIFISIILTLLAGNTLDFFRHCSANAFESKDLPKNDANYRADVLRVFRDSFSQMRSCSTPQAHADFQRSVWIVAEMKERNQLLADLVESIGSSSEIESGLAAALLPMLQPEICCAVPKLVKFLGDERPRVRGLSAQVLASIGEAARPAKNALLERANDPSSFVRIRVASALWTIGHNGRATSARLVREIAFLQADPTIDQRVLIEAIEYIGHIGPQAVDVIRTLGTLLKNGDYNTKCASAVAIIRIDPDNIEARDFLLGRLRNDHGANLHDRIKAAQVLSSISATTDEAMAVVRNSLKDESKVSYTLPYLSRMSGFSENEKLNLLLPFLKSKSAWHRQLALAQICKLGMPREMLKREAAVMLYDPDRFVQWQSRAIMDGLER